MNTLTAGGAAFPQPCTHNGYPASSQYGYAGGGITIRDYFAAKALAGMLSCEDNRTCPADKRESTEKWRDELYALYAKTAYRYADAMLMVRNDRTHPQDAVSTPQEGEP